MNPPIAVADLFVPGIDPPRENAPVRALERAGHGREILSRGISHVHEAFADYMLTNPGCTLRELAAQFGYTPPWISSVINTDMFKAYLRDRRNGIATMVDQGLPAKLEAAGHLATERIIEVLAKTDDPDLIVDSFDRIMHRLGYAPGKGQTANAPGQVTNNNVFFVEKSDLAEARAALLAQHDRPSSITELRTIEVSATPAPAEEPSSNGST